MLRYPKGSTRRRSRQAGEKRERHCKAPRRYPTLLGLEWCWRSPWCGQDIPHELWKWVEFPCLRLCHHQENDTTGSLGGLVGYLVGWFVGWLLAWLVCWLVIWLAGWLVGWLVRWLVREQVGGWIVGWLGGWSAGDYLGESSGFGAHLPPGHAKPGADCFEIRRAFAQGVPDHQ